MQQQHKTNSAAALLHGYVHSPFDHYSSLNSTPTIIFFCHFTTWAGSPNPAVLASIKIALAQGAEGLPIYDHTSPPREMLGKQQGKLKLCSCSTFPFLTLSLFQVSILSNRSQPFASLNYINQWLCTEKKGPPFSQIIILSNRFNF